MKNSRADQIVVGVVTAVAVAIILGLTQVAREVLFSTNPLQAEVSVGRSMPVPTELLGTPTLMLACDRADGVADVAGSREEISAHCAASIEAFFQAATERKITTISIEVENRGEQIAENVRVVLRGSHNVDLYLHDGKVEAPSADSVPLGDIAPGDSTSVVLWRATSYGFDETEYRVYSNAGRANQRVLWVDPEIISYNSIIRDPILMAVNAGFELPLAIFALLGALFSIALVSEIIGRLFGKKAPPPHIAPESE